MEFVQGSILERATRLEIGSGLQLTQNLEGDPILSLDPATAISLAYADSHYVRQIGDTMSGPLQMAIGAPYYGWTHGNVSGQPRILYGSDAAGAFSLVNAANALANLYAATYIAGTELQVGTSGVGRVFVTPGGSSNAGYIQFFSPSLVRQGYFGYGASGISLVMEVGNFNLNGRTIANLSIGTSGQMRATGWYTGGDLAGLGAEIGVSASNIYFLGYNRTSSAYGNVYLQGLNVHLSPQGGTSYVDGDGTGNTNPGAQSSYWLRFQSGSADRFSIGADASYVYVQSWASLPLYLNSQGNPIYTGGKLMTQLAGATYGQGNTAPIEVRSASGGGASLLWGHSNPDYIHSIGTFYSAGYPYIAFHAYQSTGDTFNRRGGSTIPFLLDYVSTTGYLQFLWSTAGTVDTGITWTRKFYFGSNGDLGIEGSLYFTAGTMRVFDDGTYLNVNGTHPFYINSNVPVTYIYSPNIFLGSTSGTGVHLRGNTLYFGATDQYYFYSPDVGPATYGTLRMGGARGGYTGFLFDDWGYYIMNHATIYGLFHPGVGAWRFRFSGASTAGAWDLLDIDNITPNKDVYINTLSLGYGLVGVYDSTKLQAVFAMSNTYRMNVAGSLSGSNFYGMAWTYDASGGGVNTGYTLSHGLGIFAANLLRSYIGDNGIWTVGKIIAGTFLQAGSYVQSGTYVAAGTYFLMNPGQVFYFDGGSDTYMYEASANQLAIVAGGILRWRIVGQSVANYSSDTTAGGQIFYRSDSALRGRVYWDVNGIGILNDQDNWSLRANYGAGYGGTLFGAWAVTGNLTLSAALSLGTTLTVTGDVTATADMYVTGSIKSKKGTSTYRDVLLGEVSSSAAPGSASGYPTGYIWLQVTAPV